MHIEADAVLTARLMWLPMPCISIKVFAQIAVLILDALLLADSILPVVAKFLTLLECHARSEIC
jgi:hypothetical protein